MTVSPIDRRTLLGWGSSALIAALGDPVVAAPARRWKRGTTVDTLTANGPGVDFTAALAAGLDAAVVDLSIWPRALPEATAELAAWAKAAASEPRLRLVRTGADFAGARAAGQFGVVLACQDANILGTPSYYTDDGNLDQLDRFREAGLRILLLTYTDANGLGDGYREPRDASLTLLGHAVISRMNADRMIVDLSHSGDRTTAAAIAVSTRPCAISHAGCRALYPSKRNKTDETIRSLADGGGYFGVYNMTLWMTRAPSSSVATIVDHVDHAVKVGGIDLVGFGSDHAILGDPMPEADKVARMRPWIERNGALPGGEPANGHITASDLDGPDRMERLAWELHRRGYPDAAIAKILGENFVAYFTRVCG